MVVLSVTNCPQQLRGDLTKWFIEIDIGVYVGKITARVREEIWSRVCDNIKNGKAIMVYSNNSEQGFAILTYNTDWTPVDCEGIWLMKKGSSHSMGTSDKLKKGFSKAAKYNQCRQVRQNNTKEYVILDVETTGLDCERDRVIEVGMLKIRGGKMVDHYHHLVVSDRVIPSSIIPLTGITRSMISENGITEQNVIKDMKKFIGNSTIIGYNVEFDINFIRKMCERQSQDMFIFRSKDFLRMVKRKLRLGNYKLETVAKACGIEVEGVHRALEDCKLIYRINQELNIF